MNDEHDNAADDRAMLAKLTPENRWYAVGDKPVRNGTPGGDYEVTDAWNVRLHNDALPHAVVDVDYFVERSPAFVTDKDDPPGCGDYAVTGMIQFAVCDDRDDPGGTETWGTIDYDNDADPLAYGNADEADIAARFQAERWIANAAEYMQWDGQPFSA